VASSDVPHRPTVSDMAIAWGSVLRNYPIRAAPSARRRIPISARETRVRDGFAPGVWSLGTAAAFYGIEREWRDLSGDTNLPSPFQSWDFAVEWFEHFVRRPAGSATGRFNILIAVDDRGRVVGIAPMFEERAGGEQGLGRVVQPFGRAQSIESMTDEPIILLRRDAEDRAYAMLLSSLASQAGRADWDVAVLPYRGSGGPGRRLLSVARTLQYVEFTRLLNGAPELKLPSSFDIFRAGLSKSMRDNISYYPRRLQREQGDWQVEFARDPRDVARATAELIDLHRARSHWSGGKQHSSHIPSDREASFLSSALARLAARGQVNLARLRVGGQTAAVQAFVERAGAVGVYYSGQAERWRRYSPLTIIMTAVIRDAIERRIGRMVFPPGTDAWKTRWGASQPAPIAETSIYSTAPAALARGLLRRIQAATAA
jgi:CelD/BcsL family acetyltransferase involved in cellulose biosynthesis